MRSFDSEVAEKPAMNVFESEIGETARWFAGPRFEGITRLYSARQVVEQRGSIPTDYTVARMAAEQFYDRLRQLFAERRQITTFGPYSPGQAVALKRMGIEGIYLGGWATSARGSVTEDPGPDLASYPLSQVPDEAAPIVRGLLTADRNQRFARSRLSEAQRAASPEIDYRPFIIADADTGHGGDAHVRNLIRRFVEAGVPGYHIEDQKPGAKKCGHQGGKVLVGVDEQIKRLSAARFQLDVMKVPGIIVARTDAEAATFLEGRGDERDHPFILGATDVELPTYKVGYLAILRKLRELGVNDARGHLLYKISAAEYDEASAWLARTGVMRVLEESAKAFQQAGGSSAEALLERVETAYLEAWQAEANLTSYPQAVADVIEFRASEGERFDMSAGEWLAFANRTSFHAARARARSMGIDIIWDCEASQDSRGLLPDTERNPVRGRQVAGCRPIRRPPVDGDQDREPGRRPALRRGHPRRVPLQDARLQPVTIVQLGHDRDERGGNEAIPGGARQAGVRLQLHHLRRTSDRRPGGRGVRHRTQAGRHALPGPAAAKVPPGRLALPDAPDARGRAAAGRGAHGLFGRNGGHQSNGQGLDTAPAPGPDRGAGQAARRMARDMDETPPDPGPAACRTAAEHGGLGVAGAHPVQAQAGKRSPTSSST